MDPSVSGFYRHVMDDVLRKTRENILIGLDEQSIDFTIDRLLSLWENKLARLSAEAQQAANKEPLLPLVNEPLPIPQAHASHSNNIRTASQPSQYLPAPQGYSGITPMTQDGHMVNPYEAILPDRSMVSSVNTKKEKGKNGRVPAVPASASIITPAAIKTSPRLPPAPTPSTMAASTLPPAAVTGGAVVGRQVKTAPVSAGRQVKTPPVTADSKKRAAESEPSAPAPPAKKGKKEEEDDEEETEKDESDDGHESELGSELDDEDDREPETDNMLLCQYTKVMRTKNRWKINAKDAILRYRGKDHLFKEVNGEFTF